MGLIISLCIHPPFLLGQGRKRRRAGDTGCSVNIVFFNPLQSITRLHVGATSGLQSSQRNVSVKLLLFVGHFLNNQTAAKWFTSYKGHNT